MTDYQIANHIARQIQEQFKAGNGLNPANMRLLLAEFIRLEIAYLCTKDVHIEKINNLQAGSARLAKQVGGLTATIERLEAANRQLMAELERAQATPAEDSDGYFEPEEGTG